MPALSFKGTTSLGPFHVQIREGSKVQTCRESTAHKIEEGNLLTLYWKQRVPIKEKPVHLIAYAYCRGVELIPYREFAFDNDFAVRDGFRDAAEMQEWFGDPIEEGETVYRVIKFVTLDLLHVTFPLATIFDTLCLEKKASDGTWCTAPYPGHKKGCPNYGQRPQCPPQAPHFLELYLERPYWLVRETFNLKAWERKQRKKWPDWSKKQCRNSRHWQGGVNSRLKKRAKLLAKLLPGGHEVLEIPEANGVDVFSVCEHLGLTLKRNPDLVHKFMIVAKKMVDPGGFRRVTLDLSRIKHRRKDLDS